VTSTVSSTVEITPTPTWQTITITPTITQPPPPPTPPPRVPDINLFLAKQEQEGKALIDKIQSLNQRNNLLRSIAGVEADVVEIPKTLDSFESLQKYLGLIQKLKNKQDPTIVAEPSISIPSTSVSTIYMSGSIPGQYSTSLFTIFLDDEGNPLERRKRQILPSVPNPVLATELVEVGEDFIEDNYESEILSSFIIESVMGTKNNEVLELCDEKTVTETVTVTRTCLP
jgi:hypothetical protein